MRRAVALLVAGALGATLGAGCRKTAGDGATVTPGAAPDRERPEPVGPHEGDSAGELEVRLHHLTAEQDRLVPLSNDDPDKCENVCSLATSICGVKEKLCNVAEDHPGDDSYQKLCREAKQECREAQDACVTCVESNRSSQPK